MNDIAVVPLHEDAKRHSGALAEAAVVDNGIAKVVSKYIIGPLELFGYAPAYLNVGDNYQIPLLKSPKSLVFLVTKIVDGSKILEYRYTE